MYAFELEHLCKQYPGFALQDVTLRLPTGCILGLVGENGAGKSTTIRLLMNAIRADSGTVRVLGVDNQSPAFLAAKEDIGVVLDEATFPELLNAKQVGQIMRYTYKRWDDACYQNYLRRFDLPQDKAFRDFSRGMKMKLALAVALSHAPRLLVLDEATGGLDPIVRDEILDIFIEFTRDEGHSVLLSSHIVSDLEKVCDYIAFLHKGRLGFVEEKDRLYEEYGIINGTAEQLAGLPAEAVVHRENGKYGGRALVHRSLLPAGSALPVERAGIEEIILLMVKGGKQ